MSAQVWVGLACLLVATKSFVAPLPTSVRRSELNQGKPQNIDEAVRELENLKPGHEASVLKSQSAVYTNVNGKEEQHLNKDHLYEKDGKLVARLSEKLDKSEAEKSAHLKTELEIPSKNIHKVLEKELSPAKISLPQRALQEVEERGGGGIRKILSYSPQDLAEYVFWTGDERGATAAVEELITDGTLSREEAITYLEEIKRDLDLIREQYLIKYEGRDEESQYPRRTQYPAGPELSEIRQQLKENFNKKADYQDSPPLQSLTEEDYEELVERLKMADLMYNEYSLEEIIYQLAKIMFRQSLSRGSAEAQDALQKFTDFLEAEAQSGRISKALEKKVLDVVIASLSDVLTQYPELVEVARESLGLLPQSHKQGIQSGHNLANDEPHRFKGKLEGAIRNSGLQDTDKKSN